MQIKEAKNFLESKNWIFAKTYAKTAPHEYIVKEHLKDQEGFEEVAKFINKNGEKEKFWNRDYTYLKVGEYKYWNIENIINRVELNN